MTPVGKLLPQKPAVCTWKIMVGGQSFPFEQWSLFREHVCWFSGGVPFFVADARKLTAGIPQYWRWFSSDDVPFHFRKQTISGGSHSLSGRVALEDVYTPNNLTWQWKKQPFDDVPPYRKWWFSSQPWEFSGGIITFIQDTLETFPEGLSAPVTWCLECNGTDVFVRDVQWRFLSYPKMKAIIEKT